MKTTNKRDAEVITLGSGDVFYQEFDEAVGMPDVAAICTKEYLLGRISGGATLEYKGDWYTAKDDTGKIEKTLITDEEVTFKTGIITWNGKTLDVLCATGRVTESNGLRYVKIGGIANDNRKSYVIVFHHTDKVDGDIWIMIRGKNQGSIKLAFAKDKETTVDAEFTAMAQDDDGTLITYAEEFKANN